MRNQLRIPRPIPQSQNTSTRISSIDLAWLLVGCSLTLIATTLSDRFFTRASAQQAQQSEKLKHFAIQVVDDQTGRGVPLVELETIQHLMFISDSQGWIAIDEPDLIDREVYFYVRSHGYELAPDGFGNRGARYRVQPGKETRLKIHRNNRAERLYRTTGSGIYRDSWLLDKPIPTRYPLINSDVVGSDSVLTAIYKDRVYWFWGDTSRSNYPLSGSFHMSGATTSVPSADRFNTPRSNSDEPGQQDFTNQLDFTENGISLECFRDEQKVLRPLAVMPGEGPTWLTSVAVLPDSQGVQRMVASYVKIRNSLEAYRWGYAQWDDSKNHFVELVSFDERPVCFPDTQSHPILYGDTNSNGATSASDAQTGNTNETFLYFCSPFPFLRVKPTVDDFIRPERYQGYSCLQTHIGSSDPKLDRNPDGALKYAWKNQTEPLSQRDQEKWIESGKLGSDEEVVRIRDRATGKALRVHNGSLAWNEYRQRWLMIFTELGGESSMLGEIWLAESPTLIGSWRDAVKILTHDRYSFYNPKHHSFMDIDGGKTIFFEGTYSHTFSGNTKPTPRYDYNQLMYRLDLSTLEND
jgi:hypothetical protein